jgi:ATP/maltotriose-dependent transcriptional regulator MalT
MNKWRLRLAGTLLPRRNRTMSFVRDLRFAVHSLARTPGLACAVILTLALGIGANAAIFTLVRGVLLRPPVTRDVIIKEVPAQAPVQPMGPFVADETRVSQLGREMEILGLIATGLSNREIAGRLFVSENAVKTHSSRLFDKLGAKRCTQAVQIGKTARLIP